MCTHTKDYSSNSNAQIKTPDYGAQTKRSKHKKSGVNDDAQTDGYGTNPRKKRRGKAFGLPNLLGCVGSVDPRKYFYEIDAVRVCDAGAVVVGHERVHAQHCIALENGAA